MPRLRSPLGASLVVLLAAAAILFWVLLQRAHGASPPGSGRALLLRSARTAEYFAGLAGASPGTYDVRVAREETRLRRLGWAVERIDEDGLGGVVAPDVVVAPATAALGDEGMAALLAAVARGAGLVATWQLGVRAADGRWRGYELLERLLGVRQLPPAVVADSGRFRYLVVRGTTALAAGLPAGARIEIQAFDPPLPVAVPGAVADWMPWEMVPVGGWAGREVPAAIARGHFGRGRVVWLNFPADAVVAAGSSAQWLDTLLANALDWAAERPRAAVATWPRSAQLAVLVGLDVEDRFGDGVPVARRLRTAGVPLTAFAVSRLAEAEPAVVRVLAGAGEVGSHTHAHRPLAGQDRAAQEAELARSRAILMDVTGGPVDGFRPPEELADATTLAALAATGYGYVAGVDTKDRAEPWLTAVGGRMLVVLPRLPRDDYEFLVRSPVVGPAAAWAAMRADLRQVRRAGGLYFFDFHTQYASRPAIAGWTRALGALAHRPEVWMATGREVAAWARARGGIAVALDAGRGELTVTSAAAVAGADVRVFLPDGVVAPELVAVEGPAPTATVRGGVEPALVLAYAGLAEGERRRTRLVLH